MSEVRRKRVQNNNQDRIADVKIKTREFLVYERQQLLVEVWTVLSSFKLKWTINGQIYIRKEAGCPGRRINSSEDIVRIGDSR